MEICLSGHGDQTLPFELQALEVPLAAAAHLFELEMNALESKLLPSLKRLTAKVRYIVQQAQGRHNEEMRSTDPTQCL